ncbi:transmembrane protein 44 isoform X4 [Archocentrus centrarchus]|uniref:transmembrane protein 44 isoform X4 n=1 Tax=Archocentrus centrarchus TaxID=63155 RepID=UPI0011E9B33A|nr:transmembrane protein 44 isoform X4 [Archocentrus centrarchus]
MKTSALIAGDHIGESPDNFLTSLVVFCVDSFNICLSRDADKLCVPVGLTFLSALLLLLSCVLFVCQRCKIRGENPGETVVFFYCFLGNLCSTTGAILSRQLHIQILMGAVAAAVDFVNCILWCFPVLLYWNSKAEKRLRMIKRRRRQHLLAVCVLMVVAGGFLKSRVSHTSALRPVKERRLLHVLLQISSWSPSMDNTEIVGYLLGLLAFVIACTARIPALFRVFGFLMRVMPWLLSSTGCVTLDLLVSLYNTEHLLGGSGLPAKNNTAMKRQTKQQIPSPAQTKTKNIQKMTELGQYMDVSSQPVGKEVALSKREMRNEPLSRRTGVIRADSVCSTDTSCDSSLVSSDLEWDFEAANAQWTKPTAKQQAGDEFPLQEWPVNPEPFNICTRSSTRLAQQALCGTEHGGCTVSLAT